MRTQTMAEECLDHWQGKAWSKRPVLRKKWRYSYQAMARLRKVAAENKA